ncbi:hypothetical protein ACWIGI_37795 [Nocardia sp. NPDC055321]
MSNLVPSDPENSTSYAEWVRQFDPGVADAAERLSEEARGTVHGTDKPGAVVDALAREAERLPEAHRPWFWDTVGHWLSAHTGSFWWGKRFRRAAATAYGRARAAERAHLLPVHVDFHRANALIFARAGALPAVEIAAHQRWLANVGSAHEAHRDFTALLVALAQGGAALGADIPRRVRASAEDAGLGYGEDSRVLTAVLAACTSAKVSDGLLDGAAKVFARVRPSDPAPLVELFPETASTGAALLRMLDAAGAVEVMAAGTLTPTRGLAGWVSRFFHMYCCTKARYGGVTIQQMPAELFDVVERIGPRLAEAGVPVDLSSGRWFAYLDADLADLLLAHGVGIAGADKVQMQFWGPASRRDLRALAAHPVLGRRLERVVHADARTTSTAIGRLPENPGIEREVHARIVAVMDRVAGNSLLDAEAAIDELDKLLDQPTIRALDGIEQALESLDGVDPLLWTLRAGIPHELCWPALDTAIAEVGVVRGVTATWPMLTVYGDDRAVVIDPHGKIADTTFTLPPDVGGHAVFYAGGEFLIGYGEIPKPVPPIRFAPALRVQEAFWANAPEERFTPDTVCDFAPLGNGCSGDLGYRFATPNGRLDGTHLLRPGDRYGVGDCDGQMSDGVRVWSSNGLRAGSGGWAEIDQATGNRGESAQLPDFHTEKPLPRGRVPAWDLLSYARLPAGVTDSPLGAVAGQSGYRITRNDRRGYPADFVVEGIDARRAEFAGGPKLGDPWGLVRMPEGGAELVMTRVGSNVLGLMRGYDAESPLWEVRSFPTWRSQVTGDLARLPMFPPPAFWHFLIPRDPAGSRALRTIDVATVLALLAGISPSAVTDPVLAESIREFADRATRLVRKREIISARVASVRAGALAAPRTPVPDSELLPALLGLLDHDSRSYPAVAPATLTAIVADGRFLAGQIDDTVRRMSPPAPPQDWTPLLGNIDAVAWRALNARTPDADRAALIALLTEWAAQPFAQPGAWRLGTAPAVSGNRTVAVGKGFLQPADAAIPLDATDVRTVTVTRNDAAYLTTVLDLLARNGVRTPGMPAVRLFVERTGVREPVARLVLDGMPRRAHLGGGFATMGAAHTKLVRTKPYGANSEVAEQYEEYTRQLGFEGCLRLVAAGMPDDPAELWSKAGDLAAAERMAAVWTELLGTRPRVPEDLTAELEAATGLSSYYARALAHPDSPDAARDDVLLGAPRSRPMILARSNRFRSVATAAVWALTERPVHDPACRGATELFERIRAGLRAPDTRVCPGYFMLTAAHFGPERYASAPVGSTVYDDGLLIVDGAIRLVQPILRTAALLDPERVDHTLATCATHGYTKLADAIRRELAMISGLKVIIDRAATTPVAPGHYEADPRQSVPDLVEHVRAQTGTGEDAATLLLQLLTLARPTDRNIRRWNDWTTARHKQAQAELLAGGLIVEDRRSRAGRTAFIPGGWADKLTKPHLPLESAKLPRYLIEVGYEEILGPYDVILPPRPLHEMFADAWAFRDR